MILKTLRQGAGKSLESIADAVGLCSPYIRRIEAGETRPLEKHHAALAWAYGITEADLRDILPAKKARKPYTRRKHRRRNGRS